MFLTDVRDRPLEKKDNTDSQFPSKEALSAILL